MNAAEQLARDIHQFLAAHARTAADFDPDRDPPEERFNGPDSAMLYAAAEALLRGDPIAVVWSSWASGCYQPMRDRAAQAVHDGLIERLMSFVAPPPTIPSV